MPFLISFSFAFILQPMVLFFQRKVKNRSLSVAIVLTIFIVIIVLTIRLTFPQIGREIKELIIKFPEILDQIETIVDNFASRFDFLPIDYQPNFDNLNVFFSKYVEKLYELPSKLVNSFFSYISIIVVMPISLIYFLLDYEKIISGLRDYLIKKEKNKLKDYLAELNHKMSSFFRGSLIVMVTLAIVTTITFLIIDLDFAFFFGIIVAITNVIPYAGPYIGALLPVVFALVDSPQKALTVILAIFIIQNIESNFFTPFVQARQNKVHPLLVILSLLVFGTLFGIIGMLIAVPMLMIIQTTLKYYPIRKYSVKVDVNG